MNEYIIVFSYKHIISAKSFYDYSEAFEQFKKYLGEAFIYGRNFVTIKDKIFTLASILDKDIKIIFDNLGTDKEFKKDFPSVIVKINKI